MNEKRDLWVLAALIAAVGLVASFVVARGGDGGGDFSLAQRQSTFLTDASGLKAFYLLLDELGIPARRITGELQIAGPTLDQLWVVNPRSPYREREKEWLKNWVEAGGVLVLVSPADAPEGPAGELLRAVSPALAAEHSEPAPSAEEGGLHPRTVELPVRNVPLLSGAETLRVRETVARGFRLEEALEGPSVRPLVEGEAGPMVFSQPRGHGRVVVIGDGFPVSNQGIDLADNAVLLTRIAELAGGGRIGFDEYHQGFRGVARQWKAVGAFLLRRPAGWALLHVAVGGFILIALRLRRFGHRPPEATAGPERRRSMTEHVHAFADLYRRAGAGGLIIETIGTSLRSEVCRWLGVSADAGEEALRGRLSGLEAEPADAALRCFEDLRRAEQGKVTEKDIEEVIRHYEQFRRYVDG